MMAPTKMKLRMRKKDASGKASQSMSAEASPDSKCPICLDRFNNMASLDRCLHKFCFRCIHEWSKNKAECPLCKQPFNSIFHTIKAENDFKEFVLRPAENGTLGSPGSPGAVRLRYGGAAAALGRERRQSPRRTSPPPDHGIMFEGLTGSAPLQQDRGVQRMMVRLAARRRAQKQGRAVRHLREQEMVTFRRALYRTGVRVRSVRDGGRHRDVSAAFFQRNPACLHRLVPWLKRELTVLYGTHGSLVNIVQHIIMSRVTRYDMDDQAIQDELRPFLLTRTDHFLHELISFARSPFSMEAYDQHAVYDCPAPSYEEGSSSDSSVIAISEDEEDPAELARRPASATGSGLSQAPWDDETPGPSYSTAEQTQSPSLSVSESASESSRGEAGGPQAQPSALVKADPTAKEDRDASSAEEDCMIVGYVKPMAERTPELVQLSSNSEEEESAREEPPQHLRFPSLSPPSSSAGSPAPKRGSPGAPGQGLPRGTPEPAGEDPCASELQRQHGSSPGGDCVAHTDAAFAPTDRPGDEPARETDAGGHGDRSRERSGSGGGRRSGSAELGCPARSPTISVHSDSTLSRGRVRSQSPSRDRVRERRRDRVAGQPRHGRGEAAAAYSYHWESYSHYSRESRSGGVLYTQSRAYRSRLYAGPARGPRPRSRSRPREPQHRARARSRSRSPSSTSSQGSRPAPRGSRHDKPGGKRKYKTRHLEESAKGRAPRAPAPPAGPALKDSRGGERRRKRSRRKSRSPSVEIVYEGKATGAARRHQRKRKKHRKRSRRHRSQEHRSPTVITIDSDSDRAADVSDRVEVSDQTTDAGPFGSENEVSAGTEPPSDAHLLESILQDLQQHILPVDQDRAAAVASAGAAAAELSPDYDKCGALRGESGHSCVSSGDEAGAGSPVITIGSHFIRQSSLDEAPDASAVCCSD
ncbi:E3 ubiquitin-protein ligase Topors-like [Anguilla anguilla]|uniref:E3 ubiquitin-protein ligase Topors-like n=1 Tax=Anguilla anguilla TaxID=7936 RepID=UPI0015A97EA4|nr:E3 ubiquitin-protein ligase Topors-like [Anguilla anguilla]XP_035280506.1 E3 ubiquitin-protein ligase Topors-like [Anguilla anguilla]